MVFIFVQSSLPDEASDEQSEVFEAVLRETVSTGFKIEPNHELIDFIVRKTAHMTEFGGLAVFVFLSLLEAIRVKRGYFRPKINLCILAGSIAIFYSVTDETHQLFVPGRVGSSFDIFVDSLGVVIAVAVIYLLITKIKEKNGQ